MKKFNISALLIVLGYAAMAQEGASQQPIVSFHGLLIGIIISLTLVLLIVVLTLQKVVQVLRAETLGLKEQLEDDRGFWEKMLSLKPLSAEKEVELDHDYDGIRELNNPIPPWFNVLFYGTVVFGFFYLIAYHMMDMAPLQAREYENEIALAEKQKEEYLKKAGNLVDESNVTQLDDKAKLADGATIYSSRCAACHGDKAEGKVGPNLTDEYWLHGGGIKNVFKTIKYGVPAKGMVAWQNTLNPMQIQQVASYVMSLQGSNPPGAKEAQGDKYVPEGSTPAVPDSSAAVPDSSVTK